MTGLVRRNPPRVAKEAVTRARLKAGDLGLDIFGMREALAKKGLRHEDVPHG